MHHSIQRINTHTARLMRLQQKTRRLIVSQKRVPIHSTNTIINVITSRIERIAPNQFRRVGGKVVGGFGDAETVAAAEDRLGVGPV